jgi:hypothetical protein
VLRQAGTKRCWPPTGPAAIRGPGAFEPPSAATLGRLPALLDADELEAGLSAWVAPTALDAQLAARIAARAAGKAAGKKRRKKKPPAGEALREVTRGPRRHRRSGSPPGPARGRRGRPGPQARQGRRQEEGAPADGGHPRHWAGARAGTKSPRPARPARSRTSGRCWNPCP